MKYAIVENGTVTNTALADSPQESNWIASDTAGVGWSYNDADGTFAAPPVVVAPTPVAPVYTKMTKRAFTGRFPKLANGVTTKYSLVELFLMDDGYAASLGVTGSSLYELRGLIITGTGTLERSPYIDFSVPDASNFTLLLTQASIPLVFRLTSSERLAILAFPILETEAYK